MAHSAVMNVMVQAAIKAGRSLARDYGEVQNLQVSLKGPEDYVRQADRKSEKIIFSELKRARPNFSFLMKKSEEIVGEDFQHRFIVDPLDGIDNFLHGIPFFAVSVALERQGQLVAGVIYNPILDELFTTERGRGAFVNDRRCRVSARRKLRDCIVATGISYLEAPNQRDYLVELHNVMVEAASVRYWGATSLNLSYVASGRIDGFWENHLEIWEMAAGILMIREAGGFVSDREGGSDIAHRGNIIAGNELIHAELKTVLAKSV